MKQVRQVLLFYLGLLAFLIIASVFFTALDYTHPPYLDVWNNRISRTLDWCAFFFLSYQFFRGLRVLDRIEAAIKSEEP